MSQNRFIISDEHFSIELDEGLPGKNDYGDFAEVYNYLFGDEFAVHICPIMLEIAKNYLKEGDETVLLDIGCGSGAVMTHLGRVLGCRCVGVDLSAEQINVARQVASESGIDVRFIVGDALDVDLPTDCDLVTMTFDVVNHFGSARNIKRLLKRVSAALRSGGVCLFDVITPKRVEMDAAAPYVLIKPGAVGVQCGISDRVLKDGVRRRLYIQVFDARHGIAQLNRLLIEHFVMEINSVVKMLAGCGMEVLGVVRCEERVADDYTFMKERVLISARKKP